MNSDSAVHDDHDYVLIVIIITIIIAILITVTIRNIRTTLLVQDPRIQKHCWCQLSVDYVVIAQMVVIFCAVFCFRIKMINQ